MCVFIYNINKENSLFRGEFFMANNLSFGDTLYVIRRHVMKTYLRLLFVLFVLSLMAVWACGGGGSTSSSGNTGSVAVFLTDGPADEYDEMWITITEVSIIPAEGSGFAPFVLYSSTAGYEVNLLDYRDEDFLFTVKHGIPVGTYEKIRLEIEEIRPVGGPCDELEIKLPSGKIDLVPRGSFEVEGDETLAIRLDIDANKSINFHEAGQSGKCIFRPVVFVDIEPVELMSRCPKILRGTLEEFIGEDPIEGFRLVLPGNRGKLDVDISETTVIFDTEGLPGSVDDLEAGQTLWVRGRLDGEGHLQATEVAIGDVLVLKGTIDSEVDNNIFSFDLDPGQSVTDPTIPVKLSGETLILVGCDNEVADSAIKPGLPALVTGKLSLIGGDLQAIAIFLKPISGELISVQEGVEHNASSGSELTIRTEGGMDVVVFLPDTVAIKLVGDGDVPAELFCPGRQVKVVIDPEKSDELSVLTAGEIEVQSDHLVGYVDEIEEAKRILVIDGQHINVRNDATILDLRDSENGDILRDFNYITYGDKVSCFGLEACEDDPTEIDFYTFVILLIED
jgi:hypothetical protein